MESRNLETPLESTIERGSILSSVKSVIDTTKEKLLKYWQSNATQEANLSRAAALSINEDRERSQSEPVILHDTIPLQPIIIDNSNMLTHNHDREYVFRNVLGYDEESSIKRIQKAAIITKQICTEFKKMITNIHGTLPLNFDILMVDSGSIIISQLVAYCIEQEHLDNLSALKDGAEVRIGNRTVEFTPKDIESIITEKIGTLRPDNYLESYIENLKDCIEDAFRPLERLLLTRDIQNLKSGEIDATKTVKQFLDLATSSGVIYRDVSNEIARAFNLIQDKAVYFQMLYVLGFSVDPSASSEAKSLMDTSKYLTKAICCVFTILSTLDALKVDTFIGRHSSILSDQRKKDKLMRIGLHAKFIMTSGIFWRTIGLIVFTGASIYAGMALSQNVGRTIVEQVGATPVGTFFYSTMQYFANSRWLSDWGARTGTTAFLTGGFGRYCGNMAIWSGMYLADFFSGTMLMDLIKSFYNYREDITEYEANGGDGFSWVVNINHCLRVLDRYNPLAALYRKELNTTRLALNSYKTLSPKLFDSSIVEAMLEIATNNQGNQPKPIQSMIGSISDHIYEFKRKRNEKKKKDKLKKLERERMDDAIAMKRGMIDRDVYLHKTHKMHQYK